MTVQNVPKPATAVHIASAKFADVVCQPLEYCAPLCTCLFVQQITLDAAMNLQSSSFESKECSLGRMLAAVVHLLFEILLRIVILFLSSGPGATRCTVNCCCRVEISPQLTKFRR